MFVMVRESVFLARVEVVGRICVCNWVGVK